MRLVSESGKWMAALQLLVFPKAYAASYAQLASGIRLVQIPLPSRIYDSRS